MDKILIVLYKGIKGSHLQQQLLRQLLLHQLQHHQQPLIQQPEAICDCSRHLQRWPNILSVEVEATDLKFDHVYIIYARMHICIYARI